MRATGRFSHTCANPDTELYTHTGPDTHANPGTELYPNTGPDLDPNPDAELYTHTGPDTHANASSWRGHCAVQLALLHCQ